MDQKLWCGGFGVASSSGREDSLAFSMCWSLLSACYLKILGVCCTIDVDCEWLSARSIHETSGAALNSALDVLCANSLCVWRSEWMTVRERGRLGHYLHVDPREILCRRLRLQDVRLVFMSYIADLTHSSGLLSTTYSTILERVVAQLVYRLLPCLTLGKSSGTTILAILVAVACALVMPILTLSASVGFFTFAPSSLK